MTGTVLLIRLALRRDRVLLPVSIAAFVLSAAGSASATKQVYPTPESVAEAAIASNATAALVALYGRIYDIHSLGAISMLKLTGFGALLVAIFALLTVVRHTRAEEESGRRELVGAGVIGRLAPLAAALVVTVGAVVAIGLLTAFGLIAVGLPAAGSFALGLGWTAAGVVFASIAAVTAQLSEGARTATGIATVTLGGAYLIRALDDASASDGQRWLSWLSPIGWSQKLRPYASERWWVVVLPLGLSIVCVGLAAGLNARRDVGAGIFQPRLGSAGASPALRSPFTLAWRLQRGGLAAWAAGFAVVGVVLGSIAGNVDSLLDNKSSRDLITKLGGVKDLTDAFLAAEFGIAGLLASGYAVQAVLRLRSEETGQRLEPVLACAVSRSRWLCSHVIIAIAGSSLLLLISGVAAGLTHGFTTHQVRGQVGRLLAAAVVQLPATWTMVAVVVFVFGIAPRFTWAGWALLVGFMLLGEFGTLFGLNHWLMDLSPYAHVPRLPGAAFSAVPLLALSAIAVALGTAGAVGFRRRDIG